MNKTVLADGNSVDIMVENSSLYMGILGLSMTVFRMVLACLCVPLILHSSADIIVVFLILAIILCDYYDGKVFRKSSLNKYEKWRSIRRILDSCADRLSIQIVCFPLLFVKPFFIIPYLVIVLKELLTSTICLKNFIRGYIIYPSTMARLSTVLVGLTVISVLICPLLVTGCCSFLLFCSGIMSLRNYIVTSSKINTGVLKEGKEYELV